MLHEEGITPAVAEAYVREWALEPPDRAAKTVEWLLDPGFVGLDHGVREGRRLCGSFMDRYLDGFRRLLTEQLTCRRCSSRMPDGGGPGSGDPQSQFDARRAFAALRPHLGTRLQ